MRCEHECHICFKWALLVKPFIQCSSFSCHQRNMAIITDKMCVKIKLNLQNKTGLQKAPKWYVHLAMNQHCCCTKNVQYVYTINIVLNWRVVILGLWIYAPFKFNTNLIEMLFMAIVLTYWQTFDFPQS